MPTIYFAQPTDGGPIKIGTTGDVESRLRQLETHYGRPMALLATMPGGRDEERAIHEQFAHLRFGRTEQFRPAPDLLAFIGRPLLVDPNHEAVEVISVQSKGSLVRMDDDLVALGKKVAALKGISLAEYFSDLLLPVVKSDFTNEIKKLSKEGIDQ
jgi:hypothetical protein